MAPMQTKRSVVPNYQETVSEPIQGTAIVIIHPGSFYLRVGRASDTYPHIIPHVIARKCKQPLTTVVHRDPTLTFDVKLPQESENVLKSTCKCIGDVLASCITSDGTPRRATCAQEVLGYNVKVKAQAMKESADFQWTRVDPQQQHVVGEEVFYLDPEEKFHVHWPIRRGQLNLHSGTGGSLTAVLSDLETIWRTAIQQCLDISAKNFRHFRAVLLVPDAYNRQHVKEMVNLLLTRLGFGACFVHQESVCATFGAGLSYACVVDVGDQKTSVSCVEDGISNRNSRLRMDYGGSDVTQIFHWLLRMSGFPYKQCDPKTTVDALLLQQLKENFCHVNLDVNGPQSRSFRVKSPQQPSCQYSIKLGDECTIAALSFLHPELLNLTGHKRTHAQQRSHGDPEDPHDENYLRETSQRRANRDNLDSSLQTAAEGLAEDGQLGSSQMDEDMGDAGDAAAAISARDGGDKDLQCDQLLSLDQAILQSIDRCGSDDMKRKMYSCILIVGGGIMFAGIHTWLRNRLSMQIPIMYRTEQIDVITRPKDMDPRITCWKGAAVMSCLDTAQELWIKQKEWTRNGVKVLRERAPFI
uniref:Actin-related protein 8 n=1 Tax=Strigamia maritima TaxID=126957 RepID=T1JFQ7_STRMM